VAALLVVVQPGNNAAERRKLRAIMGFMFLSPIRANAESARRG
jgi:hypothetical protein